MAIQQTSNGRYRATILHQGKRISVARTLGLSRATFRTKTEARKAYGDAEKLLRANTTAGVTVREFWQRWTEHPLYQRPKQSTNLHNRERTRGFVAKYGDLELDRITDRIVAEWVGLHPGTVPALRAMFNDARSGKAGRLIQINPFAQLGIRRSKGNRDVQPPSEEMVWLLISKARALCGPSFAAWLQVAAFTGMRPGELDALRWDCVNMDSGIIRVREQWNSGAGVFSTPKNGCGRDAPLTAQAREAFLSLPRVSEFCFVNFQGRHFTASARAYHWKAVKAAAGYDGTLYLATRHFAGWFMTNVHELPAEVVAIALGHSDGGYLVKTLYGHLDHDASLERVRQAYASVGQVRSLRAVKDESA